MSFQNSLLSWFEKHQRPLPWRRHYKPYEVWISEIMLQQTQMETVLPYYRRWMENFPTIESLAQADAMRVLKLWQGLGYYSRARSLHENAKRIVASGKQFPSDYESILALKGVGRYTAGAIASIAFNQDKPIVDGNVLRVLSRIYAITKPIDVEKNKDIFWKLQESLIPAGRARDFNQGLMEFGALVCLPQNPLCGSCPVKKHCLAFKRGKASDFPVRQNKKKIVKVMSGAVILSDRNKFLIHRRPEGAVMGGLWEFPEWKIAKNKKLDLDHVQQKTMALASSEFGFEIKKCHHLGAIKRNYTHHNETMQIFTSPLSAGTKIQPRKNWPTAWITASEFERYPFSSAHSKIAEKIKTQL